MKKILLATAIVTMMSGAAFAQSGANPTPPRPSSDGRWHDGADKQPLVNARRYLQVIQPSYRNVTTATTEHEAS
jgi:hypothetical protein